MTAAIADMAILAPIRRFPIARVGPSEVAPPEAPVPRNLLARARSACPSVIDLPSVIGLRLGHLLAVKDG